jgi:hypothetical protein
MSGLLWLRRWRLTAVVAVLLVAALVTGLVLMFSGPSHPTATASLPAGGRTSATLVVASGTRELSVQTANLGSTLVRASVPAGATVRPLLDQNGDVRLTLVPAAGHSANYTVRVLLTDAVTWTIVFDGGTERTVADLRGGKIAGVTFGAGSDIIDLALPRPSGTSVIRLGGGASQFLITLPPGVPAQVTAGGGAAELALDSITRTGVAGGTVVTPPGWAGAVNRFVVVATSGVDRMLVSRW